MRFFRDCRKGMWGLLPLLLISCVSTQKRFVAADRAVHPEYSKSLRQAAEAGVLFLIGDTALRDRPQKQVGTCRMLEAPVWESQVLALLNEIGRQPQLYNKFHIIEVRRGDAATFEMDQGSDGLTRLIVRYAKRTSYEKVTPMTSLTCPRGMGEYMDQNMEVTQYEWPSPAQAVDLLSPKADRAPVERLQFNRDFLIYLAERMTILKLTQDHLYKQSASGENLLQNTLNRLGAELAQDSNWQQIDFWSKEISVHSKAAMTLQFFGLSKDAQKSHGIQVDSANKLSRRVNQNMGATYLYLSYAENNNGGFAGPGLRELNKCLENLTGQYRKPGFTQSFELDTEGFLYPGYHCHSEK